MPATLKAAVCRCLRGSGSVNSKNKATSFKACFLIGYYDGKFYVYTGYLDHVVNEEYVNWYYYLRDYVGQKTQVYNYIENNKLQDPFYEQVFVPLFSEKGKQLGFIGIIPDTRKKPEKFDRIEETLSRSTGEDNSSSTLTKRIIRT